MIRIRDAATVEISIKQVVEPWDAGTGPIIIELSESTPSPGVNNGILLEDLVSFLMMEDTTSYLLQEA